MLTEPCHFFECRRSVGIDIIRAVVPCFGFQRIDGVFTGQKIDIASSERRTEFLVFRFGIEAQQALARLPDVGQKQLKKITFALTGVSENEDIACSFVFCTAVEIDKNVRLR